jgi:predicted Zn-dependent protease
MLSVKKIITTILVLVSFLFPIHAYEQTLPSPRQVVVVTVKPQESILSQAALMDDSRSRVVPSNRATHTD